MGSILPRSRTTAKQEMTLTARITSPRPQPPIGAQVSTAGGLMNAIHKARNIGAEVIQIFASNPRMWRPPSYSPNDIADFSATLRRNRLALFVHVIYLVNLASPDPTLRNRSAAALANTLHFAAKAGAEGVVLHVGSHQGDGFESALPRIAQTATEARAMAGDDGGETTPLLVESSAGGGNSVGASLSELSRLVETLPGSTGICLDTAHLFAAGYPLHTEQGLEDLVNELKNERAPGQTRSSPPQ